ncbi:hypothetical protein L6164_032191 [Bauhinia variegata]|uniref:Uncharacterized protein n=1 Tax=Bauhinia variegata TaxID=167791 RepID=A0ACB9KN39_BAUVA|nr:hypothetical protein L6164_032191 [Bauhinia variegata]
MGFSAFQKALFLQILLFPLFTSCARIALSECSDQSGFPSDFLFGTASSAYQYEGAYLSDGKGLSNWDVFSHQSGTIADASTADVSVDQYHRYLEDINHMTAMKVNSYRFSIAWARILPNGRFGEVNLEGIDYYNSLIDALLLKGIQPFVTLSHFDFPQELESRYGGWLSPQSQEDFLFYAELCFKSFGDRVKYWVTFNEPNLSVPFGYRRGAYPPGRCSGTFGHCSEGDSEKEPFLAAHNIILAHAAAVHAYRRKYQAKQGGQIGLILHFDWYEPFSNSSADKLATERAWSFDINWFLDPIIFGKYPTEMEQTLGRVLPKFSSHDKEKLKEGLDFIGINHYASFYVQDCISSVCEPEPGISITEGSYRKTAQKNGVPIGELTPYNFVNVYPQGMENVVTYVKDRYNSTPMFITENGFMDSNDLNYTENEHINDLRRVSFLEAHLDSLLAAIRKGADVRGYFVWSLLDNFEWRYGYSIRFGLHHVDYATLKRIPKLSATWYKELIEKHKTKIVMLKHDSEKRNITISSS